MIKNESDLLKYIKNNINTKSKNVIKSIGDDCAVIRILPRKYFVITTDTSLLGPHFTIDYKANDIGYKCLATNLSDIAAMGCIPRFAFLAITIPKLDTQWVKSFYRGLNQLLKMHNVALIGGDTNKGPLSISIQVVGENKTNILYRDGAKIHDDIYITGMLGSARTALMISNEKKYFKEFKILRKYLHRPTPRINIGIELASVANSCIDISDGLAKDLKCILSDSNKGAIIHIDKIPRHRLIKNVINPNKIYTAILGGGEDYELCFTAHRKYRDKITSLSKKFKIKITNIGKITDNHLSYIENGKEIQVNIDGYDHFS